MMMDSKAQIALYTTLCLFHSQRNSNTHAVFRIICKEINTDLFVFDLAGLNPCLDLVPVPLKLLDLLFQVRLELLFLIRIVRIINLKMEKE